MTKEELEKEASQKALEWNHKKINGKYNRPPIANWSCYEKGYLAGAESREKRIDELEEKISVLLSCKNCPENKGGFICQKEYEDKCLAQKIQYIKELQEENTEAKNLIEELASSLSVVGECGKEECELINKAQKFINKPIF